MRNIYNLTPTKLKGNIRFNKREFMNFPGALHKKEAKIKPNTKETKRNQQFTWFSLSTRYWVLWIRNSRQGIIFWNNSSYVSPSLKCWLRCPFLYLPGRIRDFYSHIIMHSIWFKHRLLLTWSDGWFLSGRHWLELDSGNQDLPYLFLFFQCPLSLVHGRSSFSIIEMTNSF